MTQDQEPAERPGLLQQLGRLASFSIRGKIVLPYLILTLIVAIVGTWVVTSLVATSLSERLTNQLIEAGYVVSDKLALRELEHIEAARAVALTIGLAEAVQAGDRERAAALAQPVATVQGVECLIVADAQGQAVLHVLQQSDGTTRVVEEHFELTGLWMVQALLEDGDPNALPKRGLALHLLDQRHYYFTAVPIELEDEIVGVVAVGTSLDALLSYFKQTSLADVVVYTEGGHAIGTTFALAGQSGEETPLDRLSITPELYARILPEAEITHFEDADETILGRPYRLARGPLRVGEDTIGVFAVALPSHFIIEQGSTSGNIYGAGFAAATVVVIVVGFLISQRITTPIRRLVSTSQAVAEGNLEQRTGIRSADEIGFLAETFDVMTGRLAERTRTLEETLGRLRAILSSIGDGVLLEDPDHNLIPLNAAADAMLQEMSNYSLVDPLRELAATAPGEVSATQTNPWLLERQQFEAGKRVVNAYAAAVRTEGGDHLGNVIVLRDVTSEVEADRLKDAFVAHVSHELRTPLTAIKGYSELMLAEATGPLADEQRHFLKTIHRQTESLVSMINTLLDFSELEAWDRLSLQRYPVQLSKLVVETGEEWRPQMDEKNLAFEVETQDGVPMVNIDINRLHWVIANLVRNAWQYTPEGGSVTVRLYERDGKVVLDVEDTGVGIAPEDQQNLFSRFYRVRQTTDETRGIGLGLYVSKAIINAHEGEILVSSEVGTGSMFSVILPALQDEDAAPATAA